MASQAARRRETARRKAYQKQQNKAYNAYQADYSRRFEAAQAAPVRMRYRMGYWVGRSILAGMFAVPLAIGTWIYFHA